MFGSAVLLRVSVVVDECITCLFTYLFANLNITLGPSSMEGNALIAQEDISAKMMRRARCLHSKRYSTDAVANVKMLEDEMEQCLSQQQVYAKQHELDFDESLNNIKQLQRLWRWVALIEDLCCLEQREGEDNVNSNNSSLNFSSSHSGFLGEDSQWTARGLQDSGVLKLLRMSTRDGPEESTNWMDSKSTSETLFCDEFDSPMRR